MLWKREVCRSGLTTGAMFDDSDSLTVMTAVERPVARLSKNFGSARTVAVMIESSIVILAFVSESSPTRYGGSYVLTSTAGARDPDWQ